MAYDGRLVLVKVNGTYISGLTDNSFEYTVDTFECTTKDSNGHKEYKPGEDGARISFSGLNDPAGTLSGIEMIGLAAAKVSYPIVYGAMTAGSKILSADAIITSVSLTDPKNEAAGFSGELLITGIITSSVLSDATAPLFEAAWVNNATPTVLRLKFSEILDDNYVVAGTAWSADGSSSGAKTVSSTVISGDKIYLTMQEAYVAGDTITVQYTKPGSGVDIRDKSGNQVASFGPEAVTNNVA